MASTGPSYITKNRFGIFYLQLRIPLHIRQNRPDCQALIRKSLRTRNRHEALRLARRLVVWMEQNNYEKLDEWEAKLRDEDKHLHVGLPIFRKLEQIEATGDQVAMEEFMATLSEPEFNALQYVAEQHNHVIELCERLADTDRNDKLPVLRKNLPACWHPSIDQFIATRNISEPSRIATTSTATPTNSPTNSDQSPTLQELFEKWRVIASESMRKASSNEYIRMVEFFVRVIQERNSRPNLRIHELTDKMIRDYKDILKAIPKRVKVNYHSIDEIMRMKGEARSPSTIKNTLMNVGHFLKWMEGEGYLKDTSLHGVLTYHPKVKAREKLKRVALDDQDLSLFFATDRYLQGEIRCAASDYWAPLIAIFTGCAAGEILQLEVGDIRKVNGIDVFDINDSGDKQLKVDGTLDGEGRPRIIPIHKQLKSLGFLDFVNTCSTIGLHRLFPDEERSTQTNLFSNFSKRQGYYRKKHGIKPRNNKELRDFHSFRHTVKTRLSDVEKSEGIIDDILGHTSSSRSATGQVYNHSERVNLKVTLLNKLDYQCIEFSRFRQWSNIPFGKKLKATSNRPKK